MKNLFITLLLIITTLTGFPQIRIPLNAEDAYANQHSKDNFDKLIDSNISTRFIVWSPQIKPYVITYLLDNYDNCLIQQIKLYMNNGNTTSIKFYYERKDTKEKVLLLTYTGGNWIQDYQTFNVSSTIASKFIIESQYGDFPEELQIYGSFTPHTWPLVNRQANPLKDLFGVVVKPWDIASQIFPEKIPALQGLNPSRIRLYNDYQLNHNPDGSWNIEGSDQWGGGWRTVDNEKLLKANNINTQMCYLGFPYEPFPPGEVRTDPSTYLQLAQDIYTFGVHNKANGEYFQTIEVGNEMNRWYAANFNEYMDGYALAAMMSICYDGHKGAFPNVGLKASGSKALVSLPGLAETEPYILYQIMEWSEKNRGYRVDGTIDLPFDIYSFHCYSSLGGQYSYTIGGVSPEYGMQKYFERLNTIRNRNFPWLRIHVGEWGWDISPYSPLNAPAFGRYSPHQVSAMWTVRTILLMAESGMDASSYYRIKSDYDALDDSSWTQFATMALLRANGGGVKQPDGSYLGLDIRRTLTGDYYAQLSKLLSDGWVFIERASSSPNVLKFKKGTQEMYAIWETEDMTALDGQRPTFVEKTNKYSLPFSGTIKRLVDDSSGVMSSATYVANTEIDISAKPIFMLPIITAPLPVKLVSFEVVKAGNNAKITWKVANEIDFDYYSVEKSYNGTNFSQLIKITATNSPVYSTEDRNLGPKNYYRLKMVNKDGTYSYSQIRLIIGNLERLKTIEVFNISGQLVKKYDYVYTDNVKLGLAPGMYLLRLTTDKGEQTTEKFIKFL